MYRIALAALSGGLIAGLLDLAYAFLVYGFGYSLSPVQVLHSVASGWLGRDVAEAGGWTTAMLGLGTHFVIATIMAGVFAVAARRVPALTTHAVVAGLFYGFILYVVMNYVVVPLSAAHASQCFATSVDEVVERLQIAFSAVRPKDPLLLAGTIFTHTILVGLPIALAARRFVGS